jgi:Nanos RNA binding domain
MSRKNIQKKKPYCKVCHDAGKPESMYSSHYVRSTPDCSGKTIVTCPLLQATECRYCKGLGHTVKFCTVIANKNKQDRRRQDEQQKIVINSVVEPPKNSFDILAEDDSDSEHEEETKAPTPLMGWAAVAALEAIPHPIVETKPVVKPSVKPLNLRRSWADCSDSSDDEDE